MKGTAILMAAVMGAGKTRLPGLAADYDRNGVINANDFEKAKAAQGLRTIVSSNGIC